MFSSSNHNSNTSGPLRQLTDMMLAWDDFSTSAFLVPMGLITAGLLLRLLWKKRQPRGNMQKVTLPEEVDNSSGDVLVDANEDLPEEVVSSGCNVLVDANEDLPEEVVSSGCDVLVDANEDLPEEVVSSGCDVLADANEDLPEEVVSSGCDVLVDANEDLPEEVVSSGCDVLADANEDLPEEVVSSGCDVLANANEDLPEEVVSSGCDVLVDTNEDLPEEVDSSSAQPSTSPAVLPQEPTPATDALKTEPVVEFAQPATSAAVSSGREPRSSPTNGAVKITGSFDSLFEVGKKLASGSHGIVHEGIRRLDGKPVIIKYVKKRQFDFRIGRSKPQCPEETIMRKLKHSDHVMRLIECFDSMEDHKILIMEHPGTSVTLHDFIEENGGRLTEADAKGIMQKLVAALQHCSEQGVYYKDLSLRNVLIDKDTMQIKLNCFYRALSIIERQPARFKSIPRNPALVATKEGLYRVLKKIVGEKYFALQNTHLSKDCLDLLRKLCDKESQITLENILDQDWFNNTPGMDALDNTLGTDALDNTLGTDALDNTLGTDALDNTLGTDALDNTLGTDALDNTSGTDALDNTSGTDALDNTLGTDALDNTLGTDALDNTSGMDALKPEEGHVGKIFSRSVVCKTRSLLGSSTRTRRGAKLRNWSV